MSFVQRELDQIGRALRVPQTPDNYARLYAAQQALAWAMEPNGFASPTASIGIRDIPGGSEDCSHPRRRLGS
jgi:hypothetical protein